MKAGISIMAVTGDRLSSGIDALVDQASAEGFRHLARLRQEWLSGACRFDAPGETLLVAARKEGPIGVGGITRDAHLPGALRMRRFYVHPEARREGIGRMLAEALLATAKQHGSLVTVNAGSPEAGRFWERLGFLPVSTAHRTHELHIVGPTRTSDIGRTTPRRSTNSR